jgi:PhnB protein
MDSMAQLVAYLTFNGDTKKAMAFYRNIFGGELTMQTVGQSPMGNDMPPEMKKRIMHSDLSSGKVRIMAADMMGKGKLKQGNNVFLCLVCESKDEIKALFSKLSSGGKVIHPLKEEFFGTYGDLTDKFGTNWMLQFG